MKTEMTYLELLEKLHNDIESDETMPEIIKATAQTMLKNLRLVIEPYSA